MFNYIEGTVADIDQNLAVIDCGGVGFSLNTTMNTLSQITVGKKAKLFVFDYVKEDCFELYGFSTKSEKRCFEMLLTVSGVGPKAAISILSAATPETLALMRIAQELKADLDSAIRAAPGEEGFQIDTPVGNSGKTLVSDGTKWAAATASRPRTR